MNFHLPRRRRCDLLTPAGELALALYRRMEGEALAATEPAWKEFCGLLKPALRRGGKPR